MSEPDLVVGVVNVEHDGLDGGQDKGRLERACAILRAVGAQLVLRQELKPGHGNQWLYRNARLLGGLVPLVAPATPESPNATGVFYDPKVFAPDAFYTHVTNFWHPQAAPALRFEDIEVPIAVVSFHLCHYDDKTRGTEANGLTRLIKRDRRGPVLIGGDCNSPVHRPQDELGPLKNWDAPPGHPEYIADRSNYVHRTTRVWDGTKWIRVHDDGPDETLITAGYVDAAHYAAHTLHQKQALRPTASLWRTDQGPRQRIGRAYLSPELAQCLIKVEVLDQGEAAAVSDHAMLLLHFNRAKVRAMLQQWALTA
ncbi:endonuclease/exonuclease/phosphatase family protein [Kitasatospora sp. GP82]|uniref:endonuclease/exonuclease/phosphatase family protein n=1 Tax=Kitasatospora sp. GP82 TaxID=3035089 RepID=UPI0024743B28|nr:endonuclease/exonuclease/phosphatase family protein [Kitasatospora sp. GP82]MDH6130489.1 endonuclease/exonuclease/phosphatase family metal-dependent hydrolase [Kitasatospora sp. GP82]